jgi:hypothetical protein
VRNRRSKEREARGDWKEKPESKKRKCRGKRGHGDRESDEVMERKTREKV